MDFLSRIHCLQQLGMFSLHNFEVLNFLTLWNTILSMISKLSLFILPCSHKSYEMTTRKRKGPITRHKTGLSVVKYCAVVRIQVQYTSEIVCLIIIIWFCLHFEDGSGFGVCFNVFTVWLYRYTHPIKFVSVNLKPTDVLFGIRQLSSCFGPSWQSY